jgi:hypothetical protein
MYINGPLLRHISYMMHIFISLYHVTHFLDYNMKNIEKGEIIGLNSAVSVAHIIILWAARWV